MAQMRYLLLIAALSLLSCDQRSADQIKADKQQELQQNKGLDDFYENAWIECVNEFGKDRCKVIQETGFYRCRDHRTFDGTASGLKACADERFQDRKLLLFPGASKNLPGNITEAEDPPVGDSAKK